MMYYNGVLLPDIPADMLASYPYAWIRNDTTNSVYGLIMSELPFFYDNAVKGIKDGSSVKNKPYYTIPFANAETATKWVSYGEHGYTSWGVNEARTVLWSNHDIPIGSADSTEIYFAGTAPRCLYHNNVVSITTEPTCSNEGIMTYTCTVCGDSFTETIPTNSDHNFENGECTRCGCQSHYRISYESLTAIADSIRAKTGTTEKLSPTAMPAAIEGIRGSVEAVAITSAKMVSNSNITWTLYDNGLLEFTGSGAITNTDTMSAPYYQYKDFVTKIVVGEGITSVGKYGIPNMSCVKSVTLPSTVTTMGTYAFFNYYELEEINLDNITSIDSYAFCGCKLLDVALPANIKSIGSYAFERCALTTFNPPSTLTSIGGFAFASCDFTGEVTIPATVTSGNPQMFAYCSGITKLNIRNSPTSFGFNCFGDMGNLETNIPSSVKSMGKNCFLRTTPTAVTFDDPNGWIVSTDSAGTAGVVELSSADLSDPVTAASLIVQYGGTHYFIKSA